MKEKTNYLVYKHTSPSGKAYIGITNNYARRCSKHRQEDSACTLFARAIKKYGWDNFTHEILHDSITKAEAQRLEKELIAKLDTFGAGGYNLTSGGEVPTFNPEMVAARAAKLKGIPRPKEMVERVAAANTGKTRTDEQKANMSKPRSDQSRENMRQAQLGKKRAPEAVEKQKAFMRTFRHTDESKALMSAKQKGKVMSDEAKQKISEAGRGRTVSYDTRAKLSAIHTGKEKSDEHKAALKGAWANMSEEDKAARIAKIRATRAAKRAAMEAAGHKFQRPAPKP